MAAQVPVVLAIPGILTLPGSSADWDLRLITWVNKNRPLLHADVCEYFVGPLDRAFGQVRRAKKLAAHIQSYKGQPLTLVGHSNGCDLILKALEIAGWPRVEEVHLVSGACEAHFDHNGLNSALKFDRIGKVFVYWGGRDIWLDLVAHCWPARWIGYGTLGYKGPLGVANVVKDRVERIKEDSYGHGTWWSNLNFAETMGEIMPP